MPLTVKTNRQWRNFKYRNEVPDKILASEFDWLDSEESDGFIYYRGNWYHLSQFEVAPDILKGWQGYMSDSFYSGVVITTSQDMEQYRIGTYMS